MPDFFLALINLELRLHDSVFKNVLPSDIPAKCPAVLPPVRLQDKKVFRAAFEAEKQPHPHILAEAAGNKKFPFFCEMIAQEAQNPFLFRDNHFFVLYAYQICAPPFIIPCKKEKVDQTRSTFDMQKILLKSTNKYISVSKRKKRTPEGARSS